MGYCVKMNISVYISIRNTNKIKKAFKELDNGTNYKWVNPGFSKKISIEEMFAEWRYDVKKTERYFKIENFNGENVGSCYILWKKLEKLVSPKSVIVCTGEDGMRWKWSFKQNKFKEQFSKDCWQ